MFVKEVSPFKYIKPNLIIIFLSVIHAKFFNIALNTNRDLTNIKIKYILLLFITILTAKDI